MQFELHFRFLARYIAYPRMLVLREKIHLRLLIVLITNATAMQNYQVLEGIVGEVHGTSLDHDQHYH